MRLVHLETGHFGEKILTPEWVLLLVIEIALGKVYRSQLCILLELVLTIHLRHSKPCNSRNQQQNGGWNHITSKPSLVLISK